jgi:hypothetical protein
MEQVATYSLRSVGESAGGVVLSTLRTVDNMSDFCWAVMVGGVCCLVVVVVDMVFLSCGVLKSGV